LDVCAGLLFDTQHTPEFMVPSDIEEMYYWIGNVYTSLIPVSKKNELSAHFTPPNIARYAINRLAEFGFDVASAKILDPASGGAAFLTPLSAALIKKLKDQGKSDHEIGLHISKNLSGVEIDGGLARLSGLILNDFISKKLPAFNKDLSGLIINKDSLCIAGQNSKYDAVVSNPPYGRITSPPAAILERFADSLTDKHINKYALFTRLSIDWVRSVREAFSENIYKIDNIR
jgi:adenine-specific DNA-methyltransferase